VFLSPFKVLMPVSITVKKFHVSKCQNILAPLIRPKCRHYVKASYLNEPIFVTCPAKYAEKICNNIAN